MGTPSVRVPPPCGFGISTSALDAVVGELHGIRDRKYAATVSNSGTQVAAFVAILRRIVSEPWEWTERGKVFTWHDGHGGWFKTNAMGISSDGFTYRRVLAQADALAASCAVLDRTIRSILDGA